MPRADGRAADELRPITITRNWLDHAAGSVLVEFGGTRVLCAASASAGVPRWRKASGLGWVTAEYAMLPAATNTRSDRESVKGRIGGRTHELSRLICRALPGGVRYNALRGGARVLSDVARAPARWRQPRACDRGGVRRPRRRGRTPAWRGRARRRPAGLLDRCGLG